MTSGDAAGQTGTDAPARWAETRVSVAVSLVLGALLLVTARAGFAPLIAGVAVAQAVLVVSYVFGTSMPGRKGALVLGALAAAGADTGIALRPDSVLAGLLPVVALMLPAMFVHQLMRGAARNRVVRSLGAVALLLLSVIAFGALLALSQQFETLARGGEVTGGVALVVAGATSIALVVDRFLSHPRLDPTVERGVAALLSATLVGGLIGVYGFAGGTELVQGRGIVLGASVGLASGVFAITAAFVEHTTAEPRQVWRRHLSPVLVAALPYALSAPVGLLICLAIRA